MTNKKDGFTPVSDDTNNGSPDGTPKAELAYQPSLDSSINDSSQNSKSNSDVQFSISPVWTGTAADYDKPSTQFIGTGEGAQIYGWGLYASSKKGIGRTYAEEDFRRKKSLNKNNE